MIHPADSKNLSERGNKVSDEFNPIWWYSTKKIYKQKTGQSRTTLRCRKINCNIHTTSIYNTKKKKTDM